MRYQSSELPTINVRSGDSQQPGTRLSSSRLLSAYLKGICLN